jgi:uncharacterized protein (TIGR02996 family)
MSGFPDDPEYRALWRAARDNPQDAAPRLVLADWLDENGWAEEAAYYRAGFAAAVWRLELAVREVLKIELVERSVIEVVLTDGVNKAANMIREAVAQHLAECQSESSAPKASRKRIRKVRRKK